MEFGVCIYPRLDARNVVEDAVAQARRAFENGVKQVWLPQGFTYDAMSLAGLVGVAVPGLGVGTWVVPINPRHPLTVSTGAQTAQAATQGRFSLGLGLGGHPPERQAYGTNWSHPVARLREHLEVLRAIVDTGAVHHHGTEFTADPMSEVALAGSSRLPIYVAAMGPAALRVTGELADGALPFLAGPRTLDEFVAPTLHAAAALAGRPAPRIIAAVPTVLTTGSTTLHGAGADKLAFYDTVPTFQKIVAREQVNRASDLAAVGTPDAVRLHLERYRDSAATDLILDPLSSSTEDPIGLWELAGSL